MLEFSDVSTLSFKTIIATSQGKDTSAATKLQESVEDLLLYIRAADVRRHPSEHPNNETGDGPVDSHLVSPKTVVGELLSWSIRGILQVETYKIANTSSAILLQQTALKVENLHWKTMYAALRWTLHSSVADNNDTPVVTLSTLHKIVPVTLKGALKYQDAMETDTASTDDDSGIPFFAREAFCFFVENMYKPAFDGVCDSLLPILSKAAPPQTVDDTKSWLKVTKALFYLLQSRLAHANPKKSFQLLIRPDIFIHISIIYQRLRSHSEENSSQSNDSREYLEPVERHCRAFILEGFFSLTHHIDGFRSLQLEIPKAKSLYVKPSSASTSGKLASEGFHCYQEGLLSLLRACILGGISESSAGKIVDDQECAVTISDFSVVLLDAFLLQTSKLQEQYQEQKLNDTKKKKLLSKISQIQFRVVVTVIGYHIEGLLREQTEIGDRIESFQLAQYKAIAGSLKLLLDYNIYRPSSNHREEHDFLRGVAQGIVAAMSPRTRDTPTDFADHSSILPLLQKDPVSAFHILEMLFQLDHETVQDLLKNILTCYGTKDRESSETLVNNSIFTPFLVVVIDTYKKLRQIDLFYRDFHEGLLVVLEEDKIEFVQNLNEISRCRLISAQLRDAIQLSPMQQIKNVFINANDTLSKVADSKGSVASKVAAFSAVARLLVGVVRNVRIDSTTHTELSPILSMVMRHSIPKMLTCKATAKKIDSDVSSDSISLCSWTLDSMQRCEFWTDERANADRPEIPTEILRALDNAVDNQQPIQDNTHDDVKNSRNELKLLACQRIRQLHAHMFEKQQIAYATSTDDTDLEIELLNARKLAKFVLESEESTKNSTDVDSMLTSLEILAETVQIWAPYADTEKVDGFVDFLLNRLVIDVAATGSRESSTATILRDASFAEIPNVSCRLGVRVAAYLRKTLLAVQQCDKHQPSTPLSLDNFDLGMPVKKRDTLPFNARSQDLSFVRSSIEQCHALLELISSVQSSVWENCDDPLGTLETLIAIQAAVNVGLFPLLCGKSPELPNLSGNLCRAASRLLICLCDKGGEEVLARRYKGLVESIANLFRTMSSALICLGEQEKRRFLSSHSILFSSSVRFWTNSFDDIPEGLMSVFEDDQLIAASCAIAFLRSSRCIPIPECYVMLRSFPINLWKKSQACVESHFGSDGLLWNLSTEVLAEGLRASAFRRQSSGDSIHRLDERYVSEILCRMGDDITTNTARRVSYILSCLAHCRPSERTIEEVVKKLSDLYVRRRQLFQSPLCAFATLLKPEQLSEFLNRLRIEPTDGRLPRDVANINLFHSLLLSLLEPEKLEIMSRHSDYMLACCLQLLASSSMVDERDWQSLASATSLILEIASRKEIATIRERDVALIVSSITSTLQSYGTDGDGCVAEIGVKSFESCFKILSFFLQRFSKQTQSCVSCLVRSLMTMLEFVLYVPMRDTTVLECGQQFSRLCELLLPHRDVYKKHVLSLIAQFVGGLTNDIDACRKRSLLNGIFCLFDIIQEHETRQLNSMLDEMGKALLKSVHESYKKHTYKGQ